MTVCVVRLVTAWTMARGGMVMELSVVAPESVNSSSRILNLVSAPNGELAMRLGVVSNKVVHGS